MGSTTKNKYDPKMDPALIPPNNVITSPFGVDYKILKHLAHGFDSEIYMATSNLFDEPVAMKFMEYENQYVREVMSNVYLSSTNNSYIVKLLDAFEVYNQKLSSTIQYFGVLVMEYMDGNMNGNNIPDDIIPQMILDIMQAIEKIHDAGFVHGQIWTENILYKIKSDGTYQFKIADFGHVKSHRPRDKAVEILVSPQETAFYFDNYELDIPIVPTCLNYDSDPDGDSDDEYDESQIEYYENKNFEKKKYSDLKSLGYALYEIIDSKRKLYRINLNQYPRREPDQVPSAVILNVMNRMINGKWDIGKLTEYYKSHMNR